METWTAINTIRVVREFAQRPIEPEHLDRITNAARRTASSKNRQDWTFIVVRDRAHLRELAAVGHYASHLAGAAVAIALVRPAAKNEHQLATFLWDLGRAAQDMVLAAWELGIGSVPATVYDLDLAARLLGLPDDRRCDFLLSFGYPADPAVLTGPNRAGGRATLEEVVRQERWLEEAGRPIGPPDVQRDRYELSGPVRSTGPARSSRRWSRCRSTPRRQS